MLYLLERVENMQIFAHENLVFFAFPSIKYANAMHKAAGLLRSHTTSCTNTHTHIPSTSTAANYRHMPGLQHVLIHDKQGQAGSE